MSAQPLLDDIAVLEIGGEDRVAFLQGQLTCDVTALPAGTAGLAGWCDARGRLQTTALLIDTGPGFLMLLPAAHADAIARRLRLYVLRSRVSVAPLEAAVAGGPATTAPEPGGETPAPPTPAAPAVLAGIGRDPDRRILVGDAPAVFAAARAGGIGLMDPGAWRLDDIRAGIPVVVPETAGEFVPQMINLDLLDAVSFSKGCYIGQEIIARTHYRGRIKRRMFRFAAEGPPPPAGEPVRGTRGEVGKVVNAAAAGGGAELLAVVYLDDLAGELWLGEQERRALKRLPLPYAIPEDPPG